MKFINKEARDAFYGRRKRTAQSKYPEENIYVNDHITEYRKELFYEARKLYKAKLVSKFVQHGPNMGTSLSERPQTNRQCKYSVIQILKNTAFHQVMTLIKKLSTVPSSSSSIKTHISLRLRILASRLP